MEHNNVHPIEIMFRKVSHSNATSNLLYADLSMFWKKLDCRWDLHLFMKEYK
jgi:hypothetical protein